MLGTLELPGHFFPGAPLSLSCSPHRLRIVDLITLMSGRVLSWATAVLEQQSAICLRLEDFMEEVKKVFDSPGERRPESYFDYIKNPVVWQTTQ